MKKITIVAGLETNYKEIRETIRASLYISSWKSLDNGDTSAEVYSTLLHDDYENPEAWVGELTGSNGSRSDEEPWVERIDDYPKFIRRVIENISEEKLKEAIEDHRLYKSL